MKHRIRHLHFIGIGGSGMNGIAEVMHNLGYVVSGSDLHLSSTTEHLQNIGITVFEGHDANHTRSADAVVISSAVKADNPEVLEARKRNIPVVPRALMLAELMRLRRGIAIAGTHGKTTTTSLVASILAEGGLDPTFVIGGVLNSVGVNAQLGAGEYMVVEADESDASFLNLSPVMEVITNIDRDHMDTYGHDFSRLKSAFVEFTHRMPFYGAAIVCLDDPNIRDVIPFISRPVISYGLHENADIKATQIEPEAATMRFTVKRNYSDTPTPDLQVQLNLPGIHNVQNALAAIAVATELGVSDTAIVTALEKFKGVGRRFTRYGPYPLTKSRGHFLLVDDYGHHPAEMKATILAARGAYPGKRLVLAFQPHRYTRTRDCFEDFADVLNMVDVLAIQDVYAAGEEPIVAADSRALLRAVRVKGRIEPHYTPQNADLLLWLEETLQDEDILLVMGAGSISQVVRSIVTQYGS